MDLLCCAAPFRPRRVRPDCALAPGVRLRPRRVRPDRALAPGVLERLRVLFRRDYHIAAIGCALINRLNSDGFEFVFIDSKADL